MSVATVNGLGTAHHHRCDLLAHSLLPYLPGTRSSYHIRWFTPTVEVNCCGHATLATGAHVRRARESMAIVM